MSAQWRWCSESWSQSYNPSPLKHGRWYDIKHITEFCLKDTNKWLLLKQQTPNPSAQVPSSVPPIDEHSCLCVGALFKNDAWNVRKFNFIMCTHLVKHVPFLVLPVHGSFCKSCKADVRRNFKKYIIGCRLLTEKRTIWKVLKIFPSLLPAPEFSSMLWP